MAEINLLRHYPKSRRDITKRAAKKSDEIIRISREFGFEYFDGSREYGYGGYRYDGRWLPVAQDMIAHWKLRPGMYVLDVGCAKGFLVKDMMQVCLGLEGFGLDVSGYALNHCQPEVRGRLVCGNALKLPFPDRSFDAVISINTLHNLRRAECVEALREIQRVSKNNNAYVQIDSYLTQNEREIFLEWALTPYTYDYPEGWLELFREAGYAGDYYWTFV